MKIPEPEDAILYVLAYGLAVMVTVAMVSLTIAMIKDLF